MKKEVFFVVDISGRKGRTVEATKNTVNAVLSNLAQKDSFYIHQNWKWKLKKLFAMHMSGLG